MERLGSVLKTSERRLGADAAAVAATAAATIAAVVSAPAALGRSWTLLHRSPFF